MKVAIALIALFVTSNAFAESPIRSDDQKGMMIASVEADVTGDGKAELIILSHGETASADLSIISINGNQRTIIAEKKDVAYVDELEPEAVSLDVTSKGAILVNSSQSSTGRDRWNHTLTIVMRNGKFLVAGVDLFSFDSITMKSSNCSANLLTGKIINGRRTSKFPAGGIELSKFDVETSAFSYCN